MYSFFNDSEKRQNNFSKKPRPILAGLLVGYHLVSSRGASKIKPTFPAQYITKSHCMAQVLSYRCKYKFKVFVVLIPVAYVLRFTLNNFFDERQTSAIGM